MSRTYKLSSIDLKNEAKTTLTVVCVPNGYTASAKASIILFLHGTHENSIETFLEKKKHDLDLRKALDVSGAPQQVILVAPTLSWEARGGILGGDDEDNIPHGQLKWYLQLVAKELLKQKPDPPIGDFGDPANVGKIALAAHSGGGKVMLALARTRGADTPDPYADKITECWGFDCLYGHPDGTPKSIPKAIPAPKASQEEWTAWETKQAEHRETLWRNYLRSNGVEYYLYCATGAQGGGTETRTRNLDGLAKRGKLSNVHITYDPNASHYGIVVPSFKERLKAF